MPSSDFVVTALEEVFAGEATYADSASLRAGLRFLTAEVRGSMTVDHQRIETTAQDLGRLMGYLAAHIDKPFTNTPEYVLGRITGMLEVISSASPIMSKEEKLRLISTSNPKGRFYKRILRMLAKGPKSQSAQELQSLVPQGFEEGGLSALVGAMKDLRDADYIAHGIDDFGTQVYKLTLQGFEILNHKRVAKS
jgi:hypothetical protein